MAILQRSLDDLGTPLVDTTFCVLDLETTGSSPTSCEITEIGAVKVRGGACLGTFQTLVNPGAPIPPAITVLTGITEAMVLPAPRIEAVLPSLLEFIGPSVIVGHNVRFDLAFLGAAAGRCGYPPLPNPAVDTCAVARRLVRDEVANCRLATLAGAFRLPHQPRHRALDDALATADLLHLLLERAAGLGVLGLDDLLALPRMESHPQAAKLRLTTSLPRSPGVYAFVDRHGRVLYVGKATNLRQRVRSYFSTDDRRKVGRMLIETARIDHRVCAHALEAAVLEVRLIQRFRPRYNRQVKSWDRYAYLKLTLGEPFPRLSVVRTVRDDGGLYLGPLPSARTAHLAAEAVHTVAPLRRCSARPGRLPRAAPCTPAQLGVALCPCAGGVDARRYGEVVAQVAHGLRENPALLLEPLSDRMGVLAGAERFEEAAATRDRARALALAVSRTQQLQAVRAASRVVVHWAGRGGVEMRHGRLVRAWGTGAPTLPLAAHDDGAGPGPAAAVPREQADEALVLARWLEDEAHALRLEHAEPGLACPLPPVGSFTPPRTRHEEP